MFRSCDAGDDGDEDDIVTNDEPELASSGPKVVRIRDEENETGEDARRENAALVDEAPEAKKNIPPLMGLRPSPVPNRPPVPNRLAPVSNTSASTGEQPRPSLPPPSNIKPREQPCPSLPPPSNIKPRDQPRPSLPLPSNIKPVKGHLIPIVNCLVKVGDLSALDKLRPVVT